MKSIHCDLNAIAYCAAVAILCGCLIGCHEPSLPSPIAQTNAPTVDTATTPTPPDPVATVIAEKPAEPLLTETTDTVPAATSPAAPKASLDELLLFLPIKTPADQRPALPNGTEEVWLTSSDGTRLNAWWRPHPQPVAHVLYLHGNSGNLWTTVGYLNWLHQTAECAVLAVDYRGYGLSEGSPNVAGVLQDARAARAELRERIGTVAAREVIIGRSLGGALAVDLAAEDAPRGLVLESTFASFKEVARVHAGAWAEIIPPGRLDSRSRLANYAGPLLQVHGDADKLVPFDQGVSLHAAATGPKQFVCVPGRGHNNCLTPEYLAELRRFLRELP